MGKKLWCSNFNIQHNISQQTVQYYDSMIRRRCLCRGQRWRGRSRLANGQTRDCELVGRLIGANSFAGAKVTFKARIIRSLGVEAARGLARLGLEQLVHRASAYDICILAIILCSTTATVVLLYDII